MSSGLELSKKISIIKKVFDLNKLLDFDINSKYIQRYYSISALPYSIFYNNSGFIHMGISRDGEYKDDDLLEGVNVVDNYIKKLGAKNVLELAAGRGANSISLAKRFPNVSFLGIDISHKQLDYAFKSKKDLKNLDFKVGDYHCLENFNKDFFDIVFMIESLCYSRKKEIVLGEIYNTLKKGGMLIILDGYLNKSINFLSRDERLAKKLAERGMAVENIDEYKDLVKQAKGLGYIIEKQENVSEYVLPTLYKFEKLAKKFFKFPILARAVVKLLPLEFTFNAIPGYLLVDLIESKVASYYITVLKK